jgi:hypothetical protein
MRALALIITCAACGGATSHPTTFKPAQWPVPAGWRRESIDLPPASAPRLDRAGVAELRFAPGFDDTTSPGFWSIAIGWWLDDERSIEPDALAADLARFFDGVAATADAKTHRLPVPHDRASVTLAWNLTGDARVQDPFASGGEVYLNLRVTRRTCGARRAIVFELSPSEPGARVWRDLDALAAQVDCPTIAPPPPPPPDPHHLPPR